MTVRRRQDDWMHSNFVPEYIAVSRLFQDDDLKVLVQSGGTKQRRFYTAKIFEGGTSVEVPGKFSTVEAALAEGQRLIDQACDDLYEQERVCISPELDEWDMRNGLDGLRF
jgi:hypothetical protein